MLVNTATTAIMAYQLYILSDYIHLDTAGQQKYVSIISMLLMVTAIAMSIVAGPISDRMHSRKIPVAFAALLGPIVAAAIVSATGGSYYGLFPVCAAVSLIGAVLIMMIKRVK